MPPIRTLKYVSKGMYAFKRTLLINMERVHVQAGTHPYVDKCMHMCTRAGRHTLTYGQVYAHVYTCRQAHAHIQTSVYTCVHVQAGTHPYVDKCMHMCTRAGRYTSTYRQVFTRVYACRQAHTHIRTSVYTCVHVQTGTHPCR